MLLRKRKRNSKIYSSRIMLTQNFPSDFFFFVNFTYFKKDVN